MADQNNLNVLQITDTHIFRDVRGKLLGITTENSMNSVIELAEANLGEIDFVLCTGDLVHDGSVAGYEHFRDVMESFNCPVYVLPGNHDKADVLKEVLNNGFISAELHHFVGDWQLFMLDSTVAGEDFGSLNMDELEKMNALLHEYPEKPALVCLHHQPVAVGSQWMDHIGVRNSEKLWSVLESHNNVKGILWGHIHQQYDEIKSNIKLMATPSTCVQFAPKTEDFAVDDAPPGFRWLKLSTDGGIESEVVRLPQVPEGVELDSWGYK